MKYAELIVLLTEILLNIVSAFHMVWPFLPPTS